MAIMAATKLRREIVAGITTFLTILYLFILYPKMLNSGGVDLGAAFTSTVSVTILASLFVGFYSKSPIALGPGLGAGAFLVYSLHTNQNVPWPTVLALVFWVALAMFLISLFKLRQKLIYNLPHALKLGTMGGIGLFLICVGLKELGILVPDPDTFWRVQDIGTSAHAVALITLILLMILYKRQISACYILAILFASAVGYGWGLFHVDEIMAIIPPSIKPIAMDVNIADALQLPMLSSLIALFLVNIFDTSASITTLTQLSDQMDEKGHIRNLNKLVLTDGPGGMVAALFGVGTLSFLVESSAGIKAGGRTGLTAIIVAVCSIAALFFFPVISAIPMFAIAPVLLVVGYSMAAEIKHLNWKSFTDSVPALLTFITIPLTFSIYAGFALGFISFTILKALRGQASQVHPICWVITAFFLYNYFIG